MNYVDLFLVIVVLFSIYSGYLKGFILGTIQLLMLAAGLLAAFLMYPYISSFLQKYWASLSVWTVPLAFVSALLIARIILSIIANRLLATIPDRFHSSLANQVMGVVPGAVNGGIWAILLSAFLLSVPFSDDVSTKARGSVVADKMAGQVEWLDNKFSPVFSEVVNRSINKLTVDSSSEKSISLPFKNNNPQVREDLEAKMLVLVNEERQKAGLKPLQADVEMRVVARAHSKDMFARGYFSHLSPEGLSPFDRMRKEKVRFFAAGENLAFGQTLSICHRGLMNSPGHRANILNKAFGRVGIGIVDGGIYGLMITQNFRN